MTKSYLIGIIFLGVLIIISWLVSALGTEKYLITDMATTTNDLSVSTTTEYLRQ